jgi:allantoinase
VTGGIVVTEAGSARADIAIDGERIATIGTDLAEAFAGAETILDASGMHVFPGFFDAHVHFCDQRLSHWEDFTTAGRAAVAGGVTTVMDMPLNDPVTSTAVAFENRLQAVGANAITDFALWGGCVPGNAAELEPMQSLGARAFKAFMREVDGYPWCDSDALLDGMREAARLDVPFGVHAESDPLIKARTAAMRAAGRNDAKAHMWAHSPFTEHEAISRAIALAREAGCRLHVMHVSAPDALPEIAAADHVVGEAQIGFMTMDAADYVRHGAWARFSPPLRERVDVERLWEALACGTLEYVISDHSGYPPEMKEVETIWEAADGVPAVQTCYPLLLSEGFHARQAISLEQFVTLSSATAARLYGLYPRKGALLPGVSDADLAIVDIDAEWTLETSDLHYKHPWTPQAGTEITGRVVATIRRGELVYSDGTVHAKPGSGAPV